MNKKTKYISLFSSFFLIEALSFAFLFGSKEHVWHSAYYGIMASMSGQLVAAGYSESKDEGKQMLLQFLNRDGGLLGEPILLGGAGDDVCHSIIQTYDGGYVLVGETTGQKGGKKDDPNAMIVKTNESGELLWDTVVAATPGNDILYDVAQLEDGSIVAAGTSNGQALVVKLDRHGQLLKSIAPEQAGETTLRAIATNTIGQIAVAGSRKEGKQERIFVMTLDGQLGMPRLMPNTKPGEKIGRDILYDPEKKVWWIAVGTPQGNDPPALLSWDPQADQSPETYYVAQNRNYENHLFALLRLPSGKVMGIGYSSHSDGNPALYYPFSLALNKNGALKADKIVASNGKTWAFSACVLPDGSIALAGASGPNDRAGRCWMQKLAGEKPAIKSAPVRVKIGLSAGLQEPKRDSNRANVLEGNERAYLAISLQNQEKISLHGAKINMRIKGPLAGVSYFETLYPGPIYAGTTRFGSIPLYGDFDLDRDTLLVYAALRDAQERLLDSFTVAIPTWEGPAPKLKMDTVLVGWPLNSIADREAPIRAWVKVTNVGRDTARQVRLFVGCPYLIDPMPKDSVVAALSPGASCLLPLGFKVDWLYQSASANLNCKAYEDVKGHYYSLDYKRFRLRIADYLEVRDTTGRRYVPAGIRRRGGGRAPIPNCPFAGNPEIKWEFVSDPLKNSALYEELVGQGKGRWPVYVVDVALKVRLRGFGAGLSDKDLKKIVVQRNGKASDSTELQRRSLSAQLDDGSYLFVQYLYLWPGKNEFTVAFDGVVSETLRLGYKKPNLHVFSVGVRQAIGNQPEIMQSVRDAQAVDSLFNMQSGLVFEKVVTRACFEAKDTYNQELEKFFGKISKLAAGHFGNKEAVPIQPQDYILVFISSHGVFDGHDFYIPSKTSAIENTLEYTKMDNVFNQIKGTQSQRSIFIIDACQSGGLLSTKDTWLNQHFSGERAGGLPEEMVWQKPRFTLLASCNEHEKSWIAPNGKYSLFSQALLDVLCNRKYRMTVDAAAKTNNAQKDDTGKDILPLSGIAACVQKRMEQLSQEYKTDPQTLTKLHCDDLPLYTTTEK